MFPSHDKQTVSNDLTATSVSTLDPEGSPKNDNVLIRDILANGWNCMPRELEPIWAGYDGIEVMFCIEHQNQDGDITLVPFLESNLEEDTPVKCWSVFGHCIDGGIECLHDCKTQHEANTLAKYCERMI